MELPPGRSSDVGLGVSGAAVGLGDTDDLCAWQRGGRSSRGLCSTGRKQPLCTQGWPAVCAPALEVGGGDTPPTRGHRAQQRAHRCSTYESWPCSLAVGRLGWPGSQRAGSHPHAPGPASGQSTVGQDQREEQEERSQVGWGDEAPLPQEGQGTLCFAAGRPLGP